MPCFSHLVLFVGDLPFIMDPKCTAEVLSSVLMHKTAGVCFMEKASVLEKFHSGRSYSTIGFEVNLNESTVYITLDVFKQKNI